MSESCLWLLFAPGTVPILFAASYNRRRSTATARTTIPVRQGRLLWFSLPFSPFHLKLADLFLKLLVLLDERTEPVQEELFVVSFENQLELEHLDHVLVSRRNGVVVVEEEQQHDEAGDRKTGSSQEEHDILEKCWHLQESDDGRIPDRVQATEGAAGPGRHDLDNAVLK